MKFLKYLLIILGLLIVVFFGRGLLTPSVDYECQTEVSKTAKEAWAVMSDELKMPDWIGGFKRIEHVSGTANTVGAVSNIYIDNDGQEMVMKETITAIDPNNHLAMSFSMDFMEMDYEMVLEEQDGKTLIRTKSSTIGNGLFAKSLISFMQGSMKDQEEINLQKLKNLIENNTKDYYPDPPQSDSTDGVN